MSKSSKNSSQDPRQGKSQSLLETHISELLQQAFFPDILEVTNESSMHSRGVETHFRVLCVSSYFEGKSRVQRQQDVYRVLNHIVKDQIHALAMNTLTPEEWEKSSKNFSSPNCAGKAQKN